MNERDEAASRVSQGPAAANVQLVCLVCGVFPHQCNGKWWSHHPRCPLFEGEKGNCDLGKNPREGT